MLNLFQTKARQAISDSPRISVIKAVTWRLVGSIDTIIVSFIMTGNIKIAFSIGSIEVLSKILLYYLHERAWSKLTRKK